MLSYNNDHCTYDNSADLTANLPQPQTSATTAVATATLPPHPLYLLPEHDILSALRSELGYTSSRCISSHSLHNLDVYSYMNSSSPSGRTFERSVRKVLSSGNLQGVDVVQQHTRLPNSPPANENSILLESMNRASPYSSEEKKERIERYRSKRNLRNFNKKIKYECRKTLADSRPRIRGRFVRNDETEKTTRSQWDHRGDEDEEDNWRNFLDSFHAHLIP